MKWDPRIQDYVDEYAPLEEQPRRGAGFVLGGVVALFLASVFVVLAVNAGEGESEAAAQPTRALPTPSPAPSGGDLPLTKEGVDNAAFTILHGYLVGGPEQAAFIVQDIQQRTGCVVVYGRIGTLDGVRAEFEEDTRRLEQRHGRLAGSAIEDGVGINIAFDCEAA